MAKIHDLIKEGTRMDKEKKSGNIFKRRIGRRAFLKTSLASGVGGLVGAELLRPRSASAFGGTTIQKHGEYVVEHTRKIPIVRDVDVLVVGGGMAGIGAAVAAGRMGYSTLLVEYFGCLGGNGTSGMVNNFCGYSSSSGPGKPAFQIVKGVGDDVLANLYARGGISSRTSTRFNPEILKMVLDDMFAEDSVTVLFFTKMVDVIMEENTIKGVFIENKGGRQAILAKRVCDCSGDGDVCARAGVPFELGDGKGGFLACDMAHHWVNVGSYSSSALNAAIAAAIAAGDKRITRPQVILQALPGIAGSRWVNWAGVPWKVNGTDPFQLSKAAIDGRKVANGLMEFCKEKMGDPFATAAVIDTAPMMGLRQTRRVMGDYLLNEEEVLDGVKFTDGIGACAWPIEVVDPDPLKGRTFLNLRKGGDYYLIPYRIVLPKGVENLTMAGRFVSCTFYAQASSRVMGPAVVMGQAIGTASVMSIERGVSPRYLNVGDLQQELIRVCL